MIDPTLRQRAHEVLSWLLNSVDPADWPGNERLASALADAGPVIRDLLAAEEAVRPALVDRIVFRVDHELRSNGNPGFSEGLREEISAAVAEELASRIGGSL